MKAKRKPASKAKAKAKAKPFANAPTPEFYRKLGEAFEDQENSINDLMIMAELTANASIEEDESACVFTTHHLRDMIYDFRNLWYNRRKAAQSKVA
jgi:hypothetical protein